MPSKQKTRRRPAVHIVQEAERSYEEHLLCERFGCRNVIAVWTRQKICSRCRRRGR